VRLCATGFFGGIKLSLTRIEANEDATGTKGLPRPAAK